MLTTLDLELLDLDERRIAAEEDAERYRLDAALNAERQMRERQEAEARAKAEGERWRAITGACAYLDAMPEARKDFLVRVFKRMAAAKPEHATLLERAARYVRPPANPLLETVAEVPINLLQPLTREEIEAGDRADECKRRIEAKIQAMYDRPAVQHLKCGKTRTIHLRRDRENDAVDDLLIKTKCGRIDCPHCQRRRLTKTYRRAAVVLLHASAESNLPRVGPLHVAESHWSTWEALDKSIRRQHGGDVGRLRIRRGDNSLLVICSQPFRGSRPVSPSEACDLATDAIDRMHEEQHSFRLLGDWNDSKESEWKLVQHLPGTLNLGEVAELLTALGRKSRAFKTSELQGLIWRCPNEMTAASIEVLLTTSEGLRPRARPSSSEGKYRSSRRKSDTPPSADEWGEVGDGWTPWDDPESRESTP